MSTSMPPGRNTEGPAVQPLLLEAIQTPHVVVTVRDLVAVLFRQRRILLSSFGIFFVLAILLSGALTPPYRAGMTILVRHRRLDPVVTSQSSTPPEMFSSEITESELNSEVQLLKSEDLLRKVVLDSNLQASVNSLLPTFGRPSEQVAIEKAVRGLGKRLQVELLPKTDMISVTLASSDPKQAAQVLKSLGLHYLDKHSEVTRPSGEFTFFDQETEQLRRGLDAAESRLTDFTRQKGVVSAQYERDLTLQKASELEASLAQTRAAIAETQQRISELGQQLRLVPPRVTTQLRSSDNAGLLEQMKSTLLTLELKRTEFLAKFEPTYPPIVELEKQIDQTQAAIAREGNAPVGDKTTDQNPTYGWVNSEMAKAQTDLSGLQARAAADQASLAQYRENARSMQEAAVVQEDLQRSAKTEEENYQLYLRKQEEARINDALDQRGILNVAIAEAPSVPALPARSGLYYGFIGVLAAVIGSIGSAFTADFLDPSFRTPDEVPRLLGMPLLASIPRDRKLLTS